MTARHRQQLIYILTDMLSALAVWLCFLLFRWLVYEGRVWSLDQVLIPAFGFRTPLVLYPIGCLIIYYLSGYYLRPFGKRLSREFATTMVSAVIIALGAFFVIIIDDKVTDYHHYIGSLAVLFSLQFLLCYIPRLLITLHVRKRHPKEDCIIINMPEGTPPSELYAKIREAFPTGKEILVVPQVYDYLTGAARIDELEGNPYIRISERHMSDAGICIKRAADVCLSFFGLVILLPIFAILAIMVKKSSPGPVLYSQQRIGLYGMPFNILKFRTMYDDAEKGTPKLANDDDPRITNVGHVLRRYRLDELPQLWNVLKGDMSLVGPRPERQYFINRIEEKAPYYCLLYKIRPGLTSWGPIKVGYTDTLEKMIERLNYDIAYVENQSLKLDIKILFFTIGVLMKGKGK
ncbi:MAG: sugar transferase [Paludibacteraceae bacterium]|nr:sugar transferase [Paludibacteraceae bacterium]